MGATTERFKKLIEDKKNALKNLQGEALLDATAEVVYLDYTLKKRIKDTNDPEVWDRPSMMKLFDSQLSNGNYSDVRKARIAQIKGNIPNLINRLGFTNPNEPLPEEMYEYAANPDTLTDEKMMAVRNQLYGKGMQFDLFRKPDEGIGEGQKDAIGQKYNLFTNENARSHEILMNYCNRPEISEKLDRYAGRLGLLQGRPSTNAHTFRMYLIGKKGFDFKDTYQIIPGHKDFDKLFGEFMTFLRDHPVRPLPEGVQPDKENPAVEPDVAKENAKEIMDMFNKCGDWCARYKIPDVDYTDINAVKEVQKEIGDFANFMQDYGQQMQPFIQNKLIIQEMPEDFAECCRRITPGYQIVRFAKNFEFAFTLDKDHRDLSLMPDIYLKSKANGRYLF